MRTMFNTAIAAASLAITAVASVPAHAATLVIDVTDVFSVDEFGSPLNEYGYFDIGADSHVTSIGWDLTFYADSPSWLSEGSFFFGDSTQSVGVFLTPGVGDDFPGTASYSGSGDLVDLGLDFNVGSDGLLYVEAYEGFDDYFGDWDGVYLGGTLTVGYDPADVTPSVPEPATWAMMIAGFGLTGTALRRRQTVKVSFAA